MPGCQPCLIFVNVTAPDELGGLPRAPRYGDRSTCQRKFAIGETGDDSAELISLVMGVSRPAEFHLSPAVAFAPPKIVILVCGGTGGGPGGVTSAPCLLYFAESSYGKDLMFDQPVPGGPPETSGEITGPIPVIVLPAKTRPPSGLVWPLALTTVVTVLAAVVAIAVAASRPTWGLWLSAAVVAVAVTATLITMARTRGTTTSVPAGMAAEPQPEPQPEPPMAVFGDELQRAEVFRKLSQRLQGLNHRMIHSVDQLERVIEDPDLLDGLFKIDHLATQQRRQVENVAVLGGGALQRRSETPVDVNAVFRSAVAEIEHFGQVVIVPIEDVQVHGRVVAEVIHLLAELLENATNFADPEAPKVVLRAHRVTAGLAIQIQDSGLGMPWDDRERINRLLDGSATIDLGDLLQDGRIGLGVVKELARRHHIRVRLENNIYDGVDANVVLPHDLLVVRVGAAPQPASRLRTAAPAARGVRALDTDLVGVAAAVPAVTPSARQPIGDPLAASQPTSAPLISVDVAPPALPVRAPGNSFPPPAMASPPNSVALPDTESPPLPQRSAAPTHLPPELLEAPSHPTVVPGHDPNLGAAARLGLARGQDDTVTPPTLESTRNQGEPSWPTN